MHAIIETGGKQYKVAEGDVLFIEKLPQEAGDAIKFLTRSWPSWATRPSSAPRGGRRFRGRLRGENGKGQEGCHL